MMRPDREFLLTIGCDLRENARTKLQSNNHGTGTEVRVVAFTTEGKAMAVTGICAGCKKSYTVGNKAIGKKFKCKNCGSVIEVTAHQAGVNYDFIPHPEPEESDGKSRKLLSKLGRVVFAFLVILGLVAIV